MVTKRLFDLNLGCDRLDDGSEVKSGTGLVERVLGVGGGVPAGRSCSKNPLSAITGPSR